MDLKLSYDIYATFTGKKAEQVKKDYELLRSKGFSHPKIYLRGIEALKKE